jgi:Icc-related predicted phosphoesterase
MDGVIRIVCLSDTHGLHRGVSVPDGDILIHAGDFSGSDNDLDGVRELDQWLGELPHPCKIVVPGNHDFILEDHPTPRFLLRNAIVLIDEELDVLGLRIWGSPVTPLYGGAFGRSSTADRKRLYAKIPAGIDVLVTHGPPFSVLDSAPDGTHAGCRELLETVERVSPRLHVFGHIHGAYGISVHRPTTFVNAALAGLSDQIEHVPIVMDLKRD